MEDKLLVDSILSLLIDLSDGNRLIYIISFMLIFGVVCRMLVYYTVRREFWFAKEFEKRSHGFLESVHAEGPMSFFVMAKFLLEKTYFELFEQRAINKRRNPDFVMSISDRAFLIQQGVAFLVRDTLKQIRFLKHGGQPPKLINISKTVFGNNTAFSKVFGLFPANLLTDVLNILPGVFIVSGIFGTFLGIISALPMLQGLELDNPAAAQLTIANFLGSIEFAMRSSIFGIVASVAMTVINTATSPERLYLRIVEKYEDTLSLLWNRSTDNRLPSDIPDFDEHRDPLEIMASKALEKELEKHKKELAKKGYEYSKTAS